jgi:thioredoxin-like negative regulator of GroEL
VSGIPTIIIFKDGEEAERYVGLQSEEVLSSKLDELS